MAGEPVSLQKARQDLAAFNAGFKVRMEALRKQESAALQAAVDKEVYALADLGWSVSKIAKEYGTSDWATIKRILDRRVVLPSTEEGLIVVLEDEVVYTVHEKGETVTFDFSEGYPWFTTGAQTSLADKIRKDNEFLQNLLNSAV